MFEVVEFTTFAREDVQDDVAVILQNPSFRLAAFDTDARTAPSLLHQLLDFFGDGSHLTAAGGGGDDEEVHDRRDRSHVEDEGVLALEVGAGLRGQASKLAAGLLTFGQLGCGRFGVRGSSDGSVSEISGLNGTIQKRNRPTSFAKQSLCRAMLAGHALGQTAEPQGCPTAQDEPYLRLKSC